MHSVAILYCYTVRAISRQTLEEILEILEILDRTLRKAYSDWCWVPPRLIILFSVVLEQANKYHDTRVYSLTLHVHTRLSVYMLAVHDYHMYVLHVYIVTGVALNMTQRFRWSHTPK